MSNWVDKHSVNCCICEKLFDERDGIQMWDEGTVCPDCLTKAETGENVMQLCDNCERVFHSEFKSGFLCPECG